MDSPSPEDDELNSIPFSIWQKLIACFKLINLPGKPAHVVFSKLQALLPSEISTNTSQDKDKIFHFFIRFTTLKIAFEATDPHSVHRANEKAAKEVVSYFESLQTLVSYFQESKFCFWVDNFLIFYIL